MTEAQIVKRTEWWMKRLGHLGITHWRIDVESVDECMGAEGSQAAVTPSGSYDSARIQFQRSWLKDATQQEADEVIVHELLHIASRDLMAAAHSAVDSGPMGTRAGNDERIRHEYEGVVERLARTIVNCYTP